MPPSTLPECECVCNDSECVCTSCGRRYATPHRKVRAYCKPRNVTVSVLPGGPGTELKALLKTIGIVAKPGCSCNKRARLMDEHGPDWCEQHLDEISGWLEEEAQKRKLPYIHAAGKLMVRLAIRRARKKGTNG